MKKYFKGEISRSRATLVVVFVFVVLAYQLALFVYKAAERLLVMHRDVPDTVYVVDSALARRLLADVAVDGGSAAPLARAHPASAASPAPSPAALSFRRNAPHSERARHIVSTSKYRRVENFRFNPNTVSVEELTRLGFTLKQAQSIDAYRQKGGRFRRKSDFAKSYVVSDSLFRRLEPYIEIPLLDLNLADSVAFDALPGIGGYFARQMVLHRKRLGGSYSDKRQLLEIYHFTQEKLDKIADLIQIDSASMRPYPLWTLPVDSLRLHPAIGNYTTARSLVLYREHNPLSQWTLQGLLQAGVITSSQYERLSLCYLKPPLPQ